MAMAHMQLARQRSDVAWVRHCHSPPGGMVDCWKVILYSLSKLYCFFSFLGCFMIHDDSTSLRSMTHRSVFMGPNKKSMHEKMFFNNSRCPKHPSASSISWVTSPQGFFSLPTWTSSDFFRVKTWRHCNAKRATLQLLGFRVQNEWNLLGSSAIIQSFNRPSIQSSEHPIFLGFTGYTLED